MVIGNIWAMTHDERVYPDPFAFKPERFLTADGKLNDDSRVLAYGFGKRCVPPWRDQDNFCTSTTGFVLEKRLQVRQCVVSFSDISHFSVNWLVMIVVARDFLVSSLLRYQESDGWIWPRDRDRWKLWGYRDHDVRQYDFSGQRLAGLIFYAYSHKVPFKCTITPRSEQMRKVIESTDVS